MLSFERRNKICDIVEAQGSADVASLVQQFGVSAETIRKDLILLEKNNRIQRIHGGVIPCSKAVPSMTFEVRKDYCREQKRELSEYAARFIENGDWIFLDFGSTTIELAEVLAQKFEQLHIVTHSATVFNRLAHVKNFELILCAGHYDREEDAFFGDLVIDALDRLHINKAFLCPAAISLKYGIMDCNELSIRIQRKVIESSNQVILLADSEKFEKTANYMLCGIQDPAVIVTDSGLNDQIYHLYTENDINIIRG